MELSVLEWLNNQGIRNKLLQFITVPIITIIFFFILGVSDKYHQYINSQNTKDFLSLVITLDDLVHELQKERGISVGLTKEAVTFQEIIAIQRSSTDQASLHFQNQLKKANLSFFSFEQKQLLANIKELLDQLPFIRSAVDNNDTSNVINYYSNINAQIINLIQLIELLVEKKGLARLSYAYVNLLWLQERAGQERAGIIRLLSADFIQVDYFRQILSFIESQETLINEYGIKAPPQYHNRLQQILSGSVNTKVKLFRDKVANNAIRNEFLNELNAVIGYGGIIHDFKDYVIRGDASYHKDFLQKHSEVSELIARYKKSSEMTSNDINKIEIIENVLQHYFNLVEDVKKFTQQGLSIQEIDHLVKIDDTDALIAIESLRENHIDIDASTWWEYTTERINLIKAINDQLRMEMQSFANSNSQSTLYFFWFYIFITFLSIFISFVFCLILLRRLVGSIKTISDEMERMLRENNFNRPLAISGQDEIGTMALTFNKLINERLKFETELGLSAEVFANTNEAIMIADKNQQIKIVNTAFEKLTGYAKEKVLDQDFFILKDDTLNDISSDNIWDMLRISGYWEGELWVKKQNGEVCLIWLRISIVKNKQGATIHYIGIFSDITQRKKNEDLIWHQANFDSLTGLPNRNMCKDQLSHCLKNAKRLNTKIAIFFIDLDRFKLINDTFGHSAGDELLIEVSKRLKKSVRESDMVGRLGGDEFVVILNNVDKIYTLEKISENILKTITYPIKLNNKTETYISGSIGIAFYPQDGEDVDTLIKHADIAMYQSKKKGRNNFMFFRYEMNQLALHHLKIEKELRQAIDNNQFRLHYQPIIDLFSGRIIGAEALIRWEHPTQGLIGSDKFIRIAEETDLIVPIGEWVISTAFNQAEIWNKTFNQPLKISINISSRQCINHGQDIAQLLSKTFKDKQLKSGMIDIEITESILMHGSDEMINSLQKIRDIGIGISLDDFGTGYSSLSYLKHFPISTIKIDRSFVKDITTNQKDSRLVQAIIMMAKGLELNVISEGIEQADHMEYLRKLGCINGQGYLFSHPINALQFSELLNMTYGFISVTSPKISDNDRMRTA